VQEAPSKDFSRQLAKISPRLGVLNTASEILKAYGKPIELAEVLSLAGQLETWVLGS
jgi:hypothetical protein